MYDVFSEMTCELLQPMDAVNPDFVDVTDDDDDDVILSDDDENSATAGYVTYYVSTTSCLLNDLSVCLTVQRIVEKRRIGSGCRLTS